MTRNWQKKAENPGQSRFSGTPGHLTNNVNLIKLKKNTQLNQFNNEILDKEISFNFTKSIESVIDSACYRNNKLKVKSLALQLRRITTLVVAASRSMMTKSCSLCMSTLRCSRAKLIADR